jgi:hypothetical protein
VVSLSTARAVAGMTNPLNAYIPGATKFGDQLPGAVLDVPHIAQQQLKHRQLVPEESTAPVSLLQRIR